MNTQIYEEATEWLIKHRENDLSPREKAQFDDWLRASPQHVRAYLEMSAIWEDLPALGTAGTPTADELIDRAHTQDNVRPLVGTARMTRPTADVERPVPASPDTGPKHATRARIFSLAAAVLIAFAALVSWYRLDRNTYATEIGEQRSIVLADGSTLELNSRSRVRIRYTAAQRDVDLLAGQALFRVAHDSTRPFVVHSGTTEVLAVGTQFDVYQKRAATIVTVIDGKVQVVDAAPLTTLPESPGATPLASADRSHNGGGKGILLAAGEQLTIPTVRALRVAANPPQDERPQPANVASATAWRQHNLVFDSSPLTEVAEEFNRYNRRPLVITDPQIAAMRISGMFSSVDPALFLKFLRAQPELRVEETEGEIRISKR